MHGGGQAIFVYEGALLLGFAMLFVLVFRKLGLGATLGYLIAGVLVGPQVLDLIGGAEDKIDIAELGIVFLLFVVGLELNPARLWRMKRDIFGLGTIQVLLCGVALTGVILLSTGFTVAAALALGLPLALSSTAQVLPMLQSAGRLRTPVGEKALSTLLFQDLSIIPLITVIAALSRNPADDAGPAGWELAGLTVIAVVGLVAIGRFVIQPLFRLIAVLGEREMFVVAALFTVLASAGAMQYFGLSTALGAFVAGVMLADTPYRHELEADVEPFRSILLGLFFLAVGMMLDLQVIADDPLFVLAMAAALIVTKAAVIFALGLLFGLHWRGAFALGLLLSQGGEFGFVLFAQAQEALLIAPEAVSLFGAVITISMASTPFLMAATRRLRREDAAQEATGERDGPLADGASAIVIGYGRFGQTVSQMMLASGVSVTLIDRNVGQIDMAGEFGSKVYFGDGTRLDVLRQAGAAQADAILYCVDGERLTPEFLDEVCKAFPKAQIYIRAFDRRTVMRLGEPKGITVVRELLESAIRMSRQSLEDIGLSLEDIDRAEDRYRRNDRERLDRQIESGDLKAARDRIFTRPARPGDDA